MVVGAIVDPEEGRPDGIEDGLHDGLDEGSLLGEELGDTDGTAVVGIIDGSEVGKSVTSISINT
jgi:hypothetical protein